MQASPPSFPDETSLLATNHPIERHSIWLSATNLSIDRLFMPKMHLRCRPTKRFVAKMPLCPALTPLAFPIAPAPLIALPRRVGQGVDKTIVTPPLQRPPLFAALPRSSQLSNASIASHPTREQRFRASSSPFAACAPSVAPSQFPCFPIQAPGIRVTVNAPHPSPPFLTQTRKSPLRTAGFLQVVSRCGLAL